MLFGCFFFFLLFGTPGTLWVLVTLGIGYVRSVPNLFFFATFRGLGSTSRFSYKCSRLSWHELNAVVAVAFLLCLFLDEMQLWELPWSSVWWLWNVTLRSYQLDYILKIRSSNFDEILFFSLKLKLFSLIELDGPPLETLLKLCKTQSTAGCHIQKLSRTLDSAADVLVRRAEPAGSQNANLFSRGRF